MSSDTGGLFFPKAIRHIFVGLYVEQICLAALFILARNEKGEPSAVAEGAFMVVLIVFTVSKVYEDHGRKLNSCWVTGHFSPDDLRLIWSSAEFIATDFHRQDLQRVYSRARGKGRAKLSKSSDTKPDMTHRERDDYGYQHPAASRPQRIVWMAKDCLGLSKVEMAALKDRGIDASTAGAEMNEMGNVLILDAPPDGDSRA